MNSYFLFQASKYCLEWVLCFDFRNRLLFLFYESKHCLNNLMVIIDYNKMQSYGDTEQVLSFEPLVDKWLSFGFMVNEADGHSIPELRDNFEKANVLNNKPKVIICHTVKGKGLSMAENNPSWHHKRLLDEELEMIKSEWSI